MATKSTSLATRKSTAGAVVSIKDRLAAQAAEMADRTAAPGGNSIRLSPGKFTLPDGTETEGPIQAVVVDFTSMNSYYTKGFKKGEVSPPACFAIGTNPKALAPSPNAPEPQAKTCAECPMNQWGSAPQGGNGKACKNERKLAILPPDASTSTPLQILKVSPTAIKAFDAMVSSVAHTFHTPPVGVIATIGLDGNEEYPRLTFGDVEPNPNLEEHFARQDEAKALLTAEPDVSSYEVAKPTRVAPRKAVGVKR